MNRIDERVKLFIDGFEKIINKLDTNDIYVLSLNLHLLKSAIEEYFKESDSIKLKHNTTLKNASKRMALSMNHIINDRPVFICSEADEYPMKILLINKIYALCLGISYFGYKKYLKEVNIINKFLYLLHNKKIDSEAFTIIIDIFENSYESCHKETINANTK